jgi:hypothetical protein
VLRVTGVDGVLAPWRGTDYTARSDQDRKLRVLCSSLRNRMGVKAERFGAAAAPLAGL